MVNYLFYIFLNLLFFYFYTYYTIMFINFCFIFFIPIKNENTPEKIISSSEGLQFLYFILQMNKFKKLHKIIPLTP